MTPPTDPRRPPDDAARGLYEKYAVKRLRDPGGKHDCCEYFVLDLMHDPFAAAALRAYAEACRASYPQLADDLVFAASRVEEETK